MKDMLERMRILKEELNKTEDEHEREIIMLRIADLEADMMDFNIRDYNPDDDIWRHD